jgi:glycine/D-amino acid oxidase-like deaminating enzyme
LVTPITGSRAAASWQWEQFFPVARDMYRWIETITQQSFWLEAPALRVFQSQDERSKFLERWTQAHAMEPSPSIANVDTQSLKGIIAPWGGCEMHPSARLDTGTYLSATRDYFAARDAYLEIDIDCDRDVSCNGSPSIPNANIESEFLAFCQGFASRENQWFQDLPLHPARGDILTVDLPVELTLTQVIHHNAWLVPSNGHTVRVGATYDRHTLDSTVDDRPQVLLARQELMSRLASVLALATEAKVLDHQAAVRPASYDRHPLIGRHRSQTGLYCLNGLGSKGSLMSPMLANELLDHMEGKELRNELNWQRRQL